MLFSNLDSSEEDRDIDISDITAIKVESSQKIVVIEYFKDSEFKSVKFKGSLFEFFCLVSCALE